jgi:hypothetical protein
MGAADRQIAKDEERHALDAGLLANWLAFDRADLLAQSRRCARSHPSAVRPPHDQHLGVGGRQPSLK